MLLIDEKLAQEILVYLGRRPYVEVFQLVQRLQALDEAAPPDPPREAPGD